MRFLGSGLEKNQVAPLGAAPEKKHGLVNQFVNRSEI